MDFYIKNHEFKYDVQTIIQVFYPNDSYNIIADYLDKKFVVLSIFKQETNCCYGSIFENGQVKLEKEILIDNNKDIRHAIKLSLFECLSEYTRIVPKWGVMTGIRPAKRAHSLDKISAKNLLINKYLVDEKKADLTIKVAEAEQKILDNSQGKIGLYASIPFCPSRCLYCSFTAFSIDKYAKKVDKYIDTMIKELNAVKTIIADKQIESFYIGGGTPTSLNDNQLEKLLSYICENFDVKNMKEFTVEAGRPDTITRSKLEIMKKYGVSRISVNPQTLCDKTLKIIGRHHTVLEFFEAYQTAKEVGFDNINIDLIVGLPNETEETVTETMEKLMKLNPVAITVHTLAIKRASDLKIHLENYYLPNGEIIDKMINITSQYCKKMELEPYYMYRQKNSTGNFENVGYAEAGFEGVYNVQIMAEKQPIIAVGAAASSKYFSKSENKINRIFNVKNVDDYIQRIDEMIEKKGVIEL